MCTHCGLVLLTSVASARVCLVLAVVIGTSTLTLQKVEYYIYIAQGGVLTLQIDC